MRSARVVGRIVRGVDVGAGSCALRDAALNNIKPRIIIRRFIVKLLFGQSLDFKISLTIFGFALPPDAFIV